VVLANSMCETGRNCFDGIGPSPQWCSGRGADPVSDTANKAVFLSYASEDAAAAARICTTLRQAGIEVWFDQNELRGGDAWDQKIRRQIRECALFVPIISAHAQARPEGYFRLEWRLAELRSHLIAHGRPFILPVVIDQTGEREALVPEAFLAAQWTRVRSDDTLPALATQVARLLQIVTGTAAPGGPGLTVTVPRDKRPPLIPDFELLRMIGSGGYGDVWLARGLTGVYRAIKVVWRDRFADAEPFEREFKGLKKFSSMELPEASQLALLHVGQNEGAGFFYYVMELADDVVTGREVNPAKYAPLTLKEVRAQRGRLPAAECVTFAVELARALSGLHERGLVHRDIKPSNVILVGGIPKLADIGLVAATGDALTYVGTEGFVPPEGPGKPGADVYALGRLLYELATGLDREEFPRLPSELHKLPDRQQLFELNEIILRACEPAPGKRYRDAAAMLKDLLVLQAGSSLRRQRAATLARRAGFAAVVLLAAGAGLWWNSRSGPPTAPAVPAALPVAAKSLAILPFANLSDDKENAYFADGVGEDLLTNLANVRALKVISRTTMLRYRDTRKPMSEIGRELGVAYILEGSVRRAGHTVRVTGQLIKAATDEPVWAKTYDRDVQDIFAVQTELAREIAGALQAVLTPAEATELAARPTKSIEAYDCFQQARVLYRSLADAQDVRDKIIPLLERAVALDPDYTAAWAELTRRRLELYSVDRSEAPLAQAREALAHAEKLAPDAFAVLMAGSELGAYTGDRAMVNDRRRRIMELFPNRAESHLMAALDAVNSARWADAQADFRAALRLDPLNPEVLENYFNILDSMRQWDEAEVIAATLIEVQPDNLDARLLAASMVFRHTGSTAQLTRLLAELPRSPEARNGNIVVRSRIAYLTGDWPGIISLWRESGSRFRIGGFDISTSRYMVAGAFLALGDPASARPLLEQNREEFSRQLKADPENSGLLTELGVTLGMLGDRAGARTVLDQAGKLIAASGLKPPRAFSLRWNYAMARSWVDDKPAVIRELSRLLREPSPRQTTANVHLLRVTWATIPLHGDPEFEAMLNDPANNAPLFPDSASGDTPPVPPAPP
jgi:TolB-like protein